MKYSVFAIQSPIPVNKPFDSNRISRCIDFVFSKQENSGANIVDFFSNWPYYIVDNETNKIVWSTKFHNNA